MIDAGLVRDGYDRIAARYAEARDQHSSLRFLERLDAGLSRDSLVLDLGCGAGLPVDRWLVDRGHRLVGLDLSAGMLALARRNVPEARYDLGDMADLEFEAYAVDAVVCLFAIIHVDRSQHRRVLSCLRSFLPSGGLLLITTGRTEWEGEEDFLGTPMAWSHFDGASSRALIEDAGFDVLMEDRHPDSCQERAWHPILLARAT